MRSFIRVVPIVALLIAPASSLLAQTAADPSGHWEGSIQVQPNMTINVEFDLAKNAKGEFAGTFSQPAQSVKGLPLATVTVERRAVRFVVKGGPEAATFQGTLAEDGKSISGEASQAGHSIPFTLTRTGDARIAQAPRNAPIGKELEGTWNGAIDVNGTPMRLTLTMANQPDGSAVGTIVSPDGSGVEIPVGIAQNASNVRIEIASIGASYAAIVNAASTEMSGTWTQGPTSFPLTLRHAAAAESRK
jgi:hypothetical protein